MSDEMKVILIAVAAFIVINIIMWTVIIISNKRVKRKSGSLPKVTSANEDVLARTIEIPVSEIAEEYARTVQKTVRKQELKMIESIVMIHTDEKI
ncbi:MAG: hypothetical protein IJM44_04700 [Ruminococcus sp.]|nr:hypothetical protein [Ruminococcus sp.]